MRFTPLSVFSLLAIASALPQATPPIERCTQADEGKVCNAGEINGFYLTGTCSSFPIRQDGEQYACIPLGTLDGQQPAPN